MSPLEPLSDEVLATLVATAADAVIVVADASGSIRYWNAAAEEMFGHPPESALAACGCATRLPALPARA